MKNYKLPFSIFILRIIALLTMTLDHLGVFLSMVPNSPLGDLAHIFRIIGRLAMPLFAFLLAEGMRHTRSYPKYLLRLGIMASVVSITIIALNTIPFTKESHLADGIYNIFIDLILGSLIIYFTTNKKKGLRPLALIPVALSILSFSAKAMECGTKTTVNWYPYFLRGDYDFLMTLLVVAFYYSKNLADVFVKNLSSQSGIDETNLTNGSFYRFIINLFCFFCLIILVLTKWSLSFVIDPNYLSFSLGSIENYAIISGIFILLYNGNRGYNATWFKWFSYLYYPLHLIVLFIIFMFI